MNMFSYFTTLLTVEGREVHIVPIIRAVHSVNRNRNRILFRLTETEIHEKTLPKTEPKLFRFVTEPNFKFRLKPKTEFRNRNS